MKRISCNNQFKNKTGDGLIPGKIHTIRSNYEYWKKFEGKELALFSWEGKAYQKGSTQNIFCVKKLIYVQPVWFAKRKCKISIPLFFINENDFNNYPLSITNIIDIKTISENDGFEKWDYFRDWFWSYPNGKMAILHFTDFKYRGGLYDIKRK
ncbi:hypothetical protein FACS189447_07570 [Spirochaetia bacterium]|nr:hypothetical protein FACS189447_07570 [Spirochaetia bacterium]